MSPQNDILKYVPPSWFGSRVRWYWPGQQTAASASHWPAVWQLPPEASGLWGAPAASPTGATHTHTAGLNVTLLDHESTLFFKNGLFLYQAKLTRDMLQYRVKAQFVPYASPIRCYPFRWAISHQSRWFVTLFFPSAHCTSMSASLEPCQSLLFLLNK